MEEPRSPARNTPHLRGLASEDWPFDRVGWIRVDSSGYSVVNEDGSTLYGPEHGMATLAQWAVAHRVELRAEDPWGPDAAE